MIMATQTPNIPKLIYLARRIPKPILKVHMDATPTIMVYFTSLDALSVLGRVNDNGHRRQAHIPWKIITCFAMTAVSSDRWYRFTITGVAKIINVFKAINEI